MVNPSWKRKVTTFVLTAGEHKIDLYNYGYKPESRNVTIEAHKTMVIDVTMQADPRNGIRAVGMHYPGRRGRALPCC